MEKISEYPTRVYVPGAFDILHPGHLNLLQLAKKKADIVIAGVDTDDFVALVKGAPPVFNLEDRIRMLSSCKFVDEVIVNWGGADSRRAILRAHPDFILHGNDCSEEEYLFKLGITKKWLSKFQIKLYLLPYTAGISSTLIKKRILDSRL